MTRPRVKIPRILFGKWDWKRPILSLFWVYALLALFAFFLADKLIFLPPESSYSSETPGLEFLSTAENESIAFYYKEAESGKRTILYSHGNAEDIGQYLEFFEDLQAQGLGVAAYDYPGYGLSSGKPSEAACERAIEAAWNYLIKNSVDPRTIVIAGRSVESGPSVWLASQKNNAAGLLLISPFKSTYTTAIPLPFPIFPRDRFPNLKHIQDISLPLLVIHGSDDQVIPISHGKTLVHKSPSADKQLHILEGLGHNDLFSDAYGGILAKIASFPK